MRVDLDAEGVAAESLPRFQQAPRQLRQLWRWAAASVALAAACAVLGFFIGLFAADSLWPPLLYNLGAAWLVLFAGLHAAYRVAALALRGPRRGGQRAASPGCAGSGTNPTPPPTAPHERLLERLGQAIAHGLTQLGHAALWLAASAALALCLVAAGWRLDLPPASSSKRPTSPSVSACYWPSRCAGAGTSLRQPRAGAVAGSPGSRATGAGVDRYPGAGRPLSRSWLARDTPGPAPGGTARPVAGGAGAGVAGQGDPGDVRAAACRPRTAPGRHQPAGRPVALAAASPAASAA